MNKLNIELNSNIEVVDSKIIAQLYNASKSILEPEENEIDLANMSGHISVDHAYENIILYLRNRFQDLTITVTGGLWILFLDSYVKSICSTNWASGQNPTVENLAAVTSLADKFRYNTDIVHFDEFKYFTGLSEVAQLLFLECSHLLDITLPNTITSLSNGAFMRCYDLTSINLTNITSIGNSAFSEDSELVINVADLSKITSIGGEAFIKCEKIYGDLNLPRLTTIGNGAFNSCGSITKITCLGTLAALPQFFIVKQYNSTSLLEEVYLPYECTEILWNAFNGNNNLTTIKQYTTSVNNWVVGEDPQYTNISRITTFGNQCFQDCSSLQITPSDLSGAVSIGSSPFKGCSLSGELSLPHLTYLGNEAFMLLGITSVTNLGSITEINQYAFNGCSNLETVTLPSTTKTISIRAFAGCSNLRTINLGSITTIGVEAFYLSDLTNMDINAPNLTNVDYSAFKSTNIKKVSDLGTILTLPENMFSNCNLLESITLPSSCITINNSAIYNSPNLTSINVDNVVNIKNNNFPYCTNLPKVMWFKSLTTLLFNNSNDCGHLTLQPTKHLYLPSLEGTCSGYDTGGNNVAGLFTMSGWGNTRSSFDIVYFKNLTSIQTGCFGGSIISKLVINNTTPPTVIQSLRSLTVDTLIGSTNTSETDIVNIYVPDSAVNTYKDSTNHPYWAALSSRIHPMSDLNLVADEEAFNALSAADKLNTLITAYM